MIPYQLKLDTPEAQLLSNAVEKQLRDVLQAEYDEDGALVKYVVAMVGHQQPMSTIAEQLQEFLDDKADAFASWLEKHMAENRGVYDASLKEAPSRPSRRERSPRHHSPPAASERSAGREERSLGRERGGEQERAAASERQRHSTREDDAVAGSRVRERRSQRPRGSRASVEREADLEERHEQRRRGRASDARQRSRSRSPRAPRPQRIFGLAMRHATGAPATPRAAAADDAAPSQAPPPAAPPAEDATNSAAQRDGSAAGGAGAMEVDAADAPAAPMNEVQAELARLRAAVYSMMASQMGIASTAGVAALPPHETDPNSVVVCNVHFDAAPEDVGKHLMQCSGSQVVRVTILKNRRGAPKGYCYVELVNPDGASAVLQLSGTQFMGRTLKVIPKRKVPPPKPSWATMGMSPFQPVSMFQAPWGGRGAGQGWGRGRGPARGRGRGPPWRRGTSDVWIRGISDVDPESLARYSGHLQEAPAHAQPFGAEAMQEQ